MGRSNLSSLLLRWMGWSVRITVPDYPKSVICVAPHTSNLDFVMGKLAYASVGRKAGFLMKQSWFFFPLGLIFKAIGGIPVPSKSRRGGGGGALVQAIVERYRTASTLNIAITPEGTRSRVDCWRTGFLNIAREAGVPIVLGAIDYGRKEVVMERIFVPSGDNDADIDAIKQYFRQFTARHPEQFSTATCQRRK